jgi:hypothetical protein
MADVEGKAASIDFRGFYDVARDASRNVLFTHEPDDRAAPLPRPESSV